MCVSLGAYSWKSAVHPTHAVHPVGCSAAKDTKVALQTSGRQRPNIHGVINLETGKTRMLAASTVDALSTVIMLLISMQAMLAQRIETDSLL